MNLKLLVVSLLAIALIGLYVYAMVATILIETPNEAGVGYLLSGIGGLVTAFAVGFLAIAEPNTLPTAGLNLTSGRNEVIGSSIEKAIPLAFVLTWFVCGLAAVYFGLLRPKPVESVVEVGKTWIGTVLAAVGAFWGIKPSK